MNGRIKLDNRPPVRNIRGLTIEDASLSRVVEGQGPMKPQQPADVIDRIIRDWC
jgi:hypothetical protein